MIDYKGIYIQMPAPNNTDLLEVMAEGLETMKWMWDNFTVTDPRNQEDAFNRPANSITIMQDTLAKAGIIPKPTTVEPDWLPF